MLEDRVGLQEGDRREQPTHITPVMFARGQTTRACTSAYTYLVFLK